MRTCLIIQAVASSPPSYLRGLPSVEARILEWAEEWKDEWAVDIASETGRRLLHGISRVPGVVPSSFSFTHIVGWKQQGYIIDQVELSNRVIFVLLEPPRQRFRRLIHHAGQVTTRRVITLRTWTDRMEDSRDD